MLLAGRLRAALPFLDANKMPGRPDWPGLIHGERQAAAAVCGVAESDGSAAEVGGDWRLLLRMMIRVEILLAVGFIRPKREERKTVA